MCSITILGPTYLASPSPRVPDGLPLFAALLEVEEELCVGSPLDADQESAAQRASPLQTQARKLLCRMASAINSSLLVSSSPSLNLLSSSPAMALRVARLMWMGMWLRRLRASPLKVISPARRRGEATSSNLSAILMSDSLGCGRKV